MWLKYLCCLGIFCLGISPLLSQSEQISGDLVNMYQFTLNSNPVLQRQQIQVRIAEAARQTARSQFDYMLRSDLNASRAGFNLMTLDPRRSIVGNDINTHDLTLSGQLQRTFRNGTTASVGLSYQRVADNYPLTMFNQEVGAFFADNATSTNFLISHPLLRGRGRDIVVANETLAEQGWESQQENAVFVTSGQLLNTIGAYWQYRSAYESLAAFQQNEARVRSVLDMTEQLVAADKKPNGDLVQIRADLKDKERQTVQAQQALYVARQNLGRSLGLTTEVSDNIGDPVSAFPVLDEQAPPPALEALLDFARQERADLRAFKLLLAQQATQLEVAKNNLKPQLNLNLFGSYGGSAMGNGADRFFRALTNEEGRQTQAGIGLSYQFPLNNNLAEAALLNTQLQLADQEVFLRDQIRNIELNVGIAYNNYINSAEMVRKAKQSLDYYEEVFANEQYKFQNGLTTLLNLILLQERLTFAQLEYIGARQRYAFAIGELRYETGTLYREQDGTGQTVDISIFYSLPTDR